MLTGKGHFVADGAERLKAALEKDPTDLKKIIVARYAKRLASASSEEKRALEEQMRREIEAQTKRVAPSPYALYAGQSNS